MRRVGREGHSAVDYVTPNAQAELRHQHVRPGDHWFREVETIVGGISDLGFDK